MAAKPITRDSKSPLDGEQEWPPPLARVLYSVLSGEGKKEEEW